jgi:predicted secreted acid phosphatase
MIGNDIYLKKMIDGKLIIDKRDNTIKTHVAIFDIDDTILKPIQNVLIEPIYELYEYARKNGVYTIFITAREGSNENMDLTIKQLKSLGIIGYDLLYFRPPYMDNVKEYKTFARKNVKQSGYHALFSIGDMKWDVGKYGGIPILIE